MLFRKRIERSCEYCAYGTKLDENQILCSRKGIVEIDKSCRKFSYDPCKRIPPKQAVLNTEKYSDEDFTL